MPADAKPFNGKWYRVYLKQTTWSVARNKCKTLGGQLAVVPDESTHVFLKELNRDAGLWLGATDDKIEGVWRWVDGTEMDFKGWERGEPDGGRAENYLLLFRGGWHDVSASHRASGFICEWKSR
ncbi:MAG: C-type lectin domain-containing protein [Chthoniobacteraceae bacterium]